jgi:hypothetical protein
MSNKKVKDNDLGRSTQSILTGYAVRPIHFPRYILNKQILLKKKMTYNKTKRAPLQYTATAIVRSEACNMSPAAPACNRKINERIWLFIVFVVITIL